MTLAERRALIAKDRKALAKLKASIKVTQIEITKAIGPAHKALRLRLDTVFERVVDREFLHLRAVQVLDVFERKLEERELVALEVLGHREGERGARIESHAVQDLDPQIDVAVGLLPHPVALMERVRSVLAHARGRQRFVR